MLADSGYHILNVPMLQIHVPELANRCIVTRTPIIVEGVDQDGADDQRDRETLQLLFL